MKETPLSTYYGQFLIRAFNPNGVIVTFLICICVACAPVDPTSNPKDESQCPDLFALLQTVDSATLALENFEPWPVCTRKLMPVLEGLKQNMKEDTSFCSYLNLRVFPDQDRFLFVDLLRERIERDTLEEGIYFLLHLRGIFIDDPDFSEFFAEELAHVAHHNPTCFQGYIRNNPDQEVMLLYSTKWNRMDLDTLIYQYANIDSSGPVVKHLKVEKSKQDWGS
jgi:hypothetical protein